VLGTVFGADEIAARCVDGRDFPGLRRLDRFGRRCTIDSICVALPGTLFGPRRFAGRPDFIIAAAEIRQTPRLVDSFLRGRYATCTPFAAVAEGNGVELLSGKALMDSRPEFTPPRGRS